MKCCCSSNTCGIILGTFYIVVSIIVLIFGIMAMIQVEDIVEDPERREDLKTEALETTITCTITASISLLFILAIKERSHYLMLPWLFLLIFNFCNTCRTMCWWFITAATGGVSAVVFLILFLIAALLLGIEIAIFCFSCSLFQKIRNENNEHSARVQIQFCDKTLS